MRPPYVLLKPVLTAVTRSTLVTPERIQAFVHFLAVVLSCAEVVEPLVAQVTLVRGWVGVVALVVPEGLLPLEPGRTLVAGEGLLLGVRHHVDGDFEFFEEGFGADWAGVGLGGGVQFLVVPERSDLGEPLAALFAGVVTFRRYADLFVFL